MKTGMIALVGALLGALLVGAPAHAAPSYTFSAEDVGFIDGGGDDGAPARIAAMDDYVGAKTPVVRIDLFWSDVQDCATCPPKWGRLDTLVGAAAARGVRVLLILDYSTSWANGGRPSSWFPTDDAAWAGIVEAAVAHFGDRVQAYEVWNEPNITAFGNYGDNSVDVRAGRYWQLARIAYQQVKAGCPACVVLAGGSAFGDVATVDNRTVNDNEAGDWLEWAYNHGYGDTFDAVAYHPYPDWGGGNRPTYAPAPCNVNWYRWWSGFGPDDPACGGLAYLRDVMVRHGGRAKKIWATEFGFPTTGSRTPVSPEFVRDALEEGIRSWRVRDYTGPLFLYSFQDAPRTAAVCVHNPADGECHFGLRDADGNPKEPLYTDVRTALVGGAWPAALSPGRSLFRGSALFSGSGRFSLWLQGDGNLVMYDRGVPYWVRGDLKGYRLTSQHDGNLVLYDYAGRPLWSSGTYGRGDSTLWMQDDGNLVLYPHAGTPPWATNTVRP
jgi:hypothetical protein